MIDCDDDITAPREPVPSKASWNAAPPLPWDRTMSGRTPGSRCWLRIARRVASAEQRDDARPGPLRSLARVRFGRIPDRRAERMCFGAAPIVKLSGNKITRGKTDLKDRVLCARNIWCREKDQAQGQKPHEMPFFDAQTYRPATR